MNFLHQPTLCRYALQCASVLLILSLLLLAQPSTIHSEEIKTSITSEQLEYNKDKRIYHLSGSVRIERLDTVLEADSVEYYEVSGRADASGKVRYEDREILIEAEKAIININMRTGTIFNAHVLFKEDNYHVRAEKIERVDEKNYLLRGISFTTCDAPVPEWCFISDRADIRTGDRLKADSVVLKLKGVPVLYSPLIWTPILTERKTGLLLPGIGFSSDKGLHWNQPFYFVISESMDATFHIDAFARRGIGTGIEYRYLDKSGSGQWWLYHLRDRKLDKSFVELKGSHRVSETGPLAGFLNINLINQNDFYRQYSISAEERAERFLESTGELSYNLKGGRVYLEGRLWQELRDDRTTGDISQKLPALGLSLYPKRMGHLLLSLNTTLSNFYSENLHRVQRFDLYPRIYHSMGDTVQVSQFLGIRETLYKISNSDEFPDSVGRESLDYSIRLHTRLIKRYHTLIHIVEPEIGYRIIPDSDDTLPLLDSTEIYNRVSLIEAGIRNYIYDHKGRLLSFKISELYDLHGGDRPFGLIRFESALYMPLSLQVDASYDPHHGDFQNINYSTSFRLFNTGVSLGQRYSKDNGLLFYYGGLNFPVTGEISINSSILYNAKGEGLQDLKVTANYISQCWGINITFNKRPDDYSIFFVIELKGLGAIRFSGG